MLFLIYNMGTKMRKLYLTVFGLSLLLITACSSSDKANIRYSDDKTVSIAYYGVDDSAKFVIPCIQYVFANGVKIKAEKITYTITFMSYDSLTKQAIESKIDGIIKPSVSKYPVSSMNTKNIIFAVIKLDNQKVPRTVISATIKATVKMDDDESFVFNMPIENLKGEKSMLLIPGVTSLGNSNYELQLNSIRLATRENEYLPSSEAMRVGIYSAKGRKPIWSSNNGVNYLTVIKKVQPSEVGKIHINSIVFDKSSDNIKSMPQGFYNISFLIPARPEVFSTEIECYLDK